jgi:hypothetical protein
MHPLRRLHPQSVAVRRHGAQAAACALIASLFALLLGQPFHASERPLLGSAAAAIAAAAPASALAAAHDANLCSFCRASAQTRLGLRAALRSAAAAPARPSLALHLPAPAAIGAAPLLRKAQPRAPPARLPLLAV